MDQLMPYAIMLNQEGANGRDVSSFGVRVEEFMEYSQKQFMVRLDVLNRAKGKTIEEVYKTTEAELGVVS
jgi:ribonucleoside-diphosphate reductase beta chain